MYTGVKPTKNQLITSLVCSIHQQHQAMWIFSFHLFMACEPVQNIFHLFPLKLETDHWYIIHIPTLWWDWYISHTLSLIIFTQFLCFIPLLSPFLILSLSPFMMHTQLLPQPIASHNQAENIAQTCMYTKCSWYCNLELHRSPTANLRTFRIFVHILTINGPLQYNIIP